MPTQALNGRRVTRWKTLRFLFQLGWAIILATGLLTFSKDRIISLWPPSLGSLYLFHALSVLLLGAVVVLVFRWIIAVWREMQMLSFYFAEFIPTQSGQVYVWTVLFSILLGALAYFSNEPVVFGCILAVYSLGDVWGQRLRDSQLKMMLRQTQVSEHADDPRTSAWEAIEHYYLERPQLQRSVTVMFFSFAATFLALIANLKSDTAYAPWLKCGATGVMLLNIIVSEAIIFAWRKCLARKLDNGVTL